MEDIVYYPQYKLSNNRLTCYYTTDFKNFSDQQKISTLKNIEINTSKYNDISTMGRKRLEQSINFMLYLSKQKKLTANLRQLNKQIYKNELHKEKQEIKNKKEIKYKIAFVTLTLSAKQMHTDKEIKKRMLQPFLKFLKRKGCDMYIWKAEKQKNKNIHFHILINTFIKWGEILKYWNSKQKDLGYIKEFQKNQNRKYKNGFVFNENWNKKRSYQYKRYLKGKKENWENPNSTDIHGIYKLKNIASYITKYVSKPILDTIYKYRMDIIYKNISEIKEEIKHHYIILEENTDINIYMKISELETKEKFLTERANRIKIKNGVDGRLWGQSEILSKLKPFTDVEEHGNIEHIQEIMRNERCFIPKECENDVVMYFFDNINKYPRLKKILDTHLKNCFNSEN